MAARRPGLPPAASAAAALAATATSAAAAAAAAAAPDPAGTSTTTRRTMTTTTTTTTTASTFVAAAASSSTGTVTTGAGLSVVSSTDGQPPTKVQKRDLNSFKRRQQQRKSVGGFPPPPTSNENIEDVMVLQFDAPAGAEEPQPKQDFSAHESLLKTAVETRRKGTGVVKAYLPDPNAEDPLKKIVAPDSKDLTCDLALKNQLQLAASHYSFQWLRRIPGILFSQGYPLPASHSAASDSVKQSCVEICQEYFPAIGQDPDQATLWLGRIASCLCWHQVDSAPSPVVDFTTSPDEDGARKKVAEWDEAYRSLETLLRQGALSTFSIISEHFAVTVYGDGTGPWQTSQPTPNPNFPTFPEPRAPASPMAAGASLPGSASPSSGGGGGTARPGKDNPIAVMTRSTDKLRAMLTENHVMFEVAQVDTSKPTAPQEKKGVLETLQQRPQSGEDAPKAIVPAVDGNSAIVEQSVVPQPEEDHTTDLLELRQDGETIATEVKGNAVPLALLFEGSWRVHALLDILRQFFLDMPIRAQAATPSQLPRLIAPTPFSNSSLRIAEVKKTQTVVQEDGSPLHLAELSGLFFPKQVKKLLELFLVLLPRFQCKPQTNGLSQEGINTFTRFEHRMLESIEAQRVQASGEGRKWEFKWELTLAT